ncbi:MAG TPA: glycosyltransferase family 39 protein [Vicinamibacterales bacterium]|nr:glycosyltransferase family 39 protein [Vicinamibacterales bacterium]
MTRYRPLLIVVLIAVAHGLFFIWYQRPDWETRWTDQVGYRRLGEALATTGKFTKYPEASGYVPEVIRTPVYPMFLATIYKVAGTGQLPVALAQTLLFAAICVLVFLMARRINGERVALGAALLTALFAPLPYFGALVMTELWTAFVFTVSMWIAIRAVQSRRFSSFAALGVILGITALSRPVFALFPIGIVLVGLVCFPLTGVTRDRRPSLACWAMLLAAFGITMLPWFTYNYVNFGRFTLSPAGGMGRGTWEGSWQNTWSGRLQAELTPIADDISDRATLDARIEEIAAREHLPAGPMLEYAHQEQDIRRIWTTPADPAARVAARVDADNEYMRVGLHNIRQQSASHVAARLARGVFILWAGEIPVRFSDINALPTSVIRAMWAVQALLVLAALAGIYALIRGGRAAEGCTLGAAIVYVTTVHFPILTEARQSLPAMPTVLLLAAFGVAYVTGHLLPLKPQVHEREHL